MKNLPYDKVKCKDGFWRFYADLNRASTVKSVYKDYRASGRFDALKCAWREGMPQKPHIFWDSDIAKWIEGAAYLIEDSPSEELERLVDELVEDIASNQCKDGYFNSYFISIAPSFRFTDRVKHELYCLGHMTEAAIAYHKATGKEKLLSVVTKYIDLVYRVFFEERSASFLTSGHEEIEIALLRLYEYLGNEKHLTLARFFIDQRGNNEIEEREEYNQSNLPVRELSEAVGHAVRAGYLYAAMATLSRIDGDKALKAACDRLFTDVTERKMSITGGIGSENMHERFSYAYDLPNTEVYNETCAAISLALFAGAMQETEVNSAYGDVVERVLYNGFLSGVSLDGARFFYSNALEIDRKKYSRSTYQPECFRRAGHGCSCCPSNVVRMLSSVQRYAYTVDGDTVYCNQFMASEAKLTVGGKDATLIQETRYPTDGEITFRYYGEPLTLYVRIPSWCVEYQGKTENGFARFDLTDGESVTLSLPMIPHFIEANPYVQDNAGRYAVQRGPIVYCMEEIDNGENLRDVTLLENGKVTVESEEGIPAPVIYMDAERRPTQSTLYSLKSSQRTPMCARLIPYFAFANRELSDMLVWTMVK